MTPVVIPVRAPIQNCVRKEVCFLIVMILLNKTKQEFNTSKLAKISNIVLELIALRTKKPGMTKTTEVTKKNFVC